MKILKIHYHLLLIAGFSWIHFIISAQNTTVDSICNFDSQLIDNLTRALLNKEICIGTFEIPSNVVIKQLKSGVVPESQKDYLSLTISGNLIKLNTCQIIKGDFDSSIFVKYPKYSTEENSKPKPIFYSGSKWLLLLEKSIEKNNPRISWAGDLNKKNKKLFNESTLFLSAFENYYGICLKIPDDTKPDQIPVIKEAFVSDLILISKALTDVDSKRKAERLQHIYNEEVLYDCSKELIQKILLQVNP